MFTLPSGPLPTCLGNVRVTGASGDSLLTRPYLGPYHHPWMQCGPPEAGPVACGSLPGNRCKPFVSSLFLKPVCLYDLHRPQPSWSKMTSPTAKISRKNNVKWCSIDYHSDYNSETCSTVTSIILKRGLESKVGFPDSRQCGASSLNLSPSPVMLPCPFLLGWSLRSVRSQLKSDLHKTPLNTLSIALSSP